MYVNSFSAILFACLLISCQRKQEYTINGITYARVDFHSPLQENPDSLVVLKKRRVLLVFAEGRPVKGYPISLGKHPQGHKETEGDMRTPEGRYFINDKNPNSDYHKNLGISYPNQADRQHARDLGLSPGGDIKIHGYPNGKEHWADWYDRTDWTWGCIAVSNRAVDELYERVPIGVPILILP